MAALPVSAVDTNVSGTAPTISGNSLELTKTIVMHNDGNKAIYEPNITYTYSVDEVTVPSGTTITGLVNGSSTDTGTVSV